MMRRTALTVLVASAGLAGSAAGQADAWQHKWYWGAQGGLLRFQTPTSPSWQTAVTAGGHWLITGTRSALYVAFDQVFFKDSTKSAVVDPTSPTGVREVDFKNGRRIQAQLYIFPTDTWIQVYLGGGFGIHQLTDAAPPLTATFSTPQAEEAVLRVIDQTSTKAFPIASGGLQLRLGRLAVFGQAQYMPVGRNYLISSAQYVFAGGLRYAVTASREDVTSQR